LATTFIRPYKAARGVSAADAMNGSFEYGLNPGKCKEVSAYLCDPATAHAEFLLTKSQYQAETGRKSDSGILFFQIRQAFPRGGISPEEASRIGYETAMRWTKGKYQFFVCTHTDQKHIHNHIYYNSTAFDRSRKFHNFIGSSFAVRRLSDRVCLEHGLSVIENPKQHSEGKYKHYGEWQKSADGKPLSFQQKLKAQIAACLYEKPQSFDDFLSAMTVAGYEHKYGRGGVLSFRTEGQKNFTRLRSSTLGDGYDLKDIISVIEGRSQVPAELNVQPRKVDLIIDIQERMRNGKGAAYERWAKVYNLKQMAAALQYLQENRLLKYEQLEKRAAASTDSYHDLAGQIKKVEAALERNSALQTAVTDYAKTRSVFAEYKAKKYSNRYLAEHKDDILVYRSAQASMKELLQGAPLPKMETLKAEAVKLAADKKALYKQYRDMQSDMREAVVVKSNIDHLLGITGAEKNKEQER